MELAGPKRGWKMNGERVKLPTEIAAVLADDVAGYVEPSSPHSELLAAMARLLDATVRSGMLDASAASETVVQTLNVPFEYPVMFSQDILDPGNTTLRRAITWRETARKHRTFVVIDRGVSDSWPNLISDVVDYVQAHSD